MQLISKTTPPKTGCAVADSRPRRIALAAGIALALLLAGGPSRAADEPRAMLSLYAGQGVDANLPDMPGKWLRGALRYDPSYFAAIGWHAATDPPSWLAAFGDALGASQVATGWEVIGVKHHGLQENGELDLAWLIRVPPAVWGALRMRFGFGIGASYALGTPRYEDGPRFAPARRYRLQQYNAYELDWSVGDHSAWSVVTRIHHRSGVFGLVAPPRVGSNFVTLGVRWQY
ncbi:MAG: hypothetical protein OEW21_03295 [Betaproteobacteria bacterium]|nr:hypothetical protein [Betaproteobacteria bacterium]